MILILVLLIYFLLIGVTAVKHKLVLAVTNLSFLHEQKMCQMMVSYPCHLICSHILNVLILLVYLTLEQPYDVFLEKLLLGNHVAILEKPQQNAI